MPKQCWILCGKQENWCIAIKDEIWGLIPKFQGKWRHLKLKDYLFFYATNPISGVIGFGKVQAKFKQNQPLWPDELSKKEVLYPFRFEFQSEYILPQEAWSARKIKISFYYHHGGRILAGLFTAIFSFYHPQIFRKYPLTIADWLI